MNAQELLQKVARRYAELKSLAVEIVFVSEEGMRIRSGGRRRGRGLGLPRRIRYGSSAAGGEGKLR
jgi:hypothetical protein